MRSSQVRRAMLLHASGYLTKGAFEERGSAHSLALHRARLGNLLLTSLPSSYLGGRLRQHRRYLSLHEHFDLYGSRF